MPTISCSMIVGNLFSDDDYAEDLKRCLDSINGVFDEIVLVHTDNREGIKELATQYKGMKYYHEPYSKETWDFSDARNKSFNYATKDYVFVIDHDEALAEATAHNLRIYLDGLLEYDCLLFKLINIMDDKKSMFYPLRLWKRGKVHSEGIIHNQFVPDDDCKMVGTDLLILHYGYDFSDKAMKSKYDRTEALLRKQIETNPDNLFAWMNLVRIWRCREQFDNIINYTPLLMKYNWSSNNPTLYHQIITDCVYAMMLVGGSNIANGNVKLGWELARDSYRVIKEVCMQFPDSIDAWYYYCHCAYLNQEYNAVLAGGMMYFNIRSGIDHRHSQNVMESYGSELNVLNVMFMAREKLGISLRIPS